MFMFCYVFPPLFLTAPLQRRGMFRTNFLLHHHHRVPSEQRVQEKPQATGIVNTMPSTMGTIKRAGGYEGRRVQADCSVEETLPLASSRGKLASTSELVEGSNPPVLYVSFIYCSIACIFASFLWCTALLRYVSPPLPPCLSKGLSTSS